MPDYKILSLVVPLFFMASGQDASADWIRDSLDKACSEESASLVAERARKRVEDHVSRAESAIKPPIPVGDLSCLEDLMDTPLDIFSGSIGLPDLTGIFNDTLDGVIDMGDGITRNVCQFAEEKWQEVTEPLNSAVSGVGGIGDNFDAFASTGSGTGGSNSFGRSNSSSGTGAQTDPSVNWRQTESGVFFNQQTGQAFVPESGLYYENGAYMGTREAEDVLPPSIVGALNPTSNFNANAQTGGIWNNLIGRGDK